MKRSAPFVVAFALIAVMPRDLRAYPGLHPSVA